MPYHEALSAITLCGGDASQLLTLYRKGWGLKTTTVGSRSSVQMMMHVVWAQGMGDKSVNPNGNKILPTDAEISMMLAGTIAGQTLYPREPHMRSNADGLPTFKCCELLSAQQLKGYVSRPRAQLLAQLNNLKTKEASEKAQALAVVAAADKLSKFQIDEPDRFYVTEVLKTVPKIKEELSKLDPTVSRTGKRTDLIDRLVAVMKSLRQEQPGAAGPQLPHAAPAPIGGIGVDEDEGDLDDVDEVGDALDGEEEMERRGGDNEGEIEGEGDDIEEYDDGDDAMEVVLGIGSS
jgi:hypothetical protein